MANQRDERGDTWTYDFTVTDNQGVAVDITGATFEFGLNVEDQSGLVVDIPSTDGTVTVTDGPAGKGTVTVNAATTSITPVGTYLYKLRMTLAGRVDTIEQGTWVVTADVLEVIPSS